VRCVWRSLDDVLVVLMGVGRGAVGGCVFAWSGGFRTWGGWLWGWDAGCFGGDGLIGRGAGGCGAGVLGRKIAVWSGAASIRRLPLDTVYFFNWQ